MTTNGAVYDRAYRAGHPESCSMSQSKYRASHRPEVNALARRYYQAHREEILAKAAKYNRIPRSRAWRFLRNFPDCTSTLEEVEAIYAAGLSALDGLPCLVSPAAYHLDHVHGGPAIGLIPNGLNKQLTAAYMRDFDAGEAARWLNAGAIAYIVRRRELET